jgi:hypothetical protein
MYHVNCVDRIQRSTKCSENAILQYLKLATTPSTFASVTEEYWSLNNLGVTLSFQYDFNYDVQNGSNES